ncbi:MAG: AMP-binding protein [Clostridia bacterium]|nr:AMP-binding protein [Clostridia bacterium]
MQINEDISYKLKRRKIALGEMEGEISGYPSIDMPWLKYYTEEHILAPIPDDMSCYDYLRMTNIHNQDNIAIEYFDQKISYRGLFQNINQTSKALVACGIKQGDVVTIILPACPEEIYLLYALDQIGACANFIFPMTPLAEVEKTMELFNSKLLVVLDDFLCQPNSIIENEQITEPV